MRLPSVVPAALLAVPLLSGQARAALPADLSVAPDAAPAAAQTVELYLDVTLDGQPTGRVAPFTQGPNGLRCPVQNLRDLGLDPDLFGVADRDSFDLGAIPGLTYTYDAARQHIDLRLADALRHTRDLSVTRARGQATPDAGSGLLLNYDMHAALGGGTVAAVTELRWFDRNGVLANTGATMLRGPGRGYVRYDTTWTRADPDALTMMEIGDVVAPALAWTRALRLGGIQWRRNFALRPDLLTYPMASYGGSAVVPSSVSLYVDGMRQFQAEVGGGPFRLHGIGGVNGAGEATVVTEDALGRTTSATVPLYVDTRLLETGLTDYAVSLGAPRRGYGLRSFDYGPGAVLVASLRHGWSDALTLEGHAEAARGVAGAGAGVLVRLGGAGVVSAALAASAGSGKAGGRHAEVGYQYIGRGFALDAASERANATFADAGSAQGAPAVRESDRFNLSVALARGQSLGLGIIHYAAPAQPPARIVSLSFARQLGWGLHASVSAYRDLLRPEARGVQLTLSTAIGERASGSATVGSQNGAVMRALYAAGAPDASGGFGWSAQKGRYGSQDEDQLQLRYLGAAGQAGVLTQGMGRRRSTAVDVSGSLVAMDGAVLAARHVGRGFALVTTGTAGVPVLQENRLIGTTDGGGRLLVPDLAPYIRNDIAIDASALPADVRVPALSRSVVPRESAGVVARFMLERYAAATVVVTDADGAPVSPGILARLEGGAASIVGYDGVVFVEGLGRDNVLVVGEGAGACRVRFAYLPVAGGTLPVIGPLVCQPERGQP